MGDDTEEMSDSQEELPQEFSVRYLGWRECGGLWGMKHTRGPVDFLVTSAQENTCKPTTLKVTKDSCSFRSNTGVRFSYTIPTISYGVQDLVYTRVFAMIVVGDRSPFACHAFACDSGLTARKLTYCLAAAFQDYARRLKSSANDKSLKYIESAIDLRSPEDRNNSCYSCIESNC